MTEGHARATGAVPNGKSKVIHPENDPDFKYPIGHAVQCAFFDTVEANPARRAYAAKANSMLQQHNLELRLALFSTDAKKIDYSRPYDGDSEAQAAEIFEAAKKVSPPDKTVLPVIFCMIKDDRPENGETFPRPSEARPVPDPEGRWVLLYTNKIYTADYVTLLHEIGHAAGLGHAKWNAFNPDRRFDFMGTPGDPEMDKPETGTASSSFIGEDGEKKLQELKDGKLGRNTIFKKELLALLKAPFTVQIDRGLAKMQW